MKQKISILGSTGSIGLQSLDIISKNKNSFIIYLLSANKNLYDELNSFYIGTFERLNIPTSYLLTW